MTKQDIKRENGKIGKFLTLFEEHFFITSQTDQTILFRLFLESYAKNDSSVVFHILCESRDIFRLIKKMQGIFLFKSPYLLLLVSGALSDLTWHVCLERLNSLLNMPFL